MSDHWPEYTMDIDGGTISDGNIILKINGKDYVMDPETAAVLAENLIELSDEDGDDDERRSLRDGEDNE